MSTGLEPWAEGRTGLALAGGSLVVPKVPGQGDDAGAVPALCLCPHVRLGQGEKSQVLTPHSAPSSRVSISIV